ncbi:hypothetical protein [Micromonospora halophytica]|uniref:Uncharacterized protein n=1 Tax=Micromonospora halophytica TaxID=47864 RepID=A0A1C5IVT7_9ACTN|nr:hypothetical protein [Micromonospora halophytica]SCG62477.1 hypothetical protein GA0070560_11755 [Micromonospora halophytica]
MRTAAATTGLWTRLLLLACTLLGLAAMHTVGHGAHGSGHFDGRAVAQGAVVPGQAAFLAVHADTAPVGPPLTVGETHADAAAEALPAAVVAAHAGTAAEEVRAERPVTSTAAGNGSTTIAAGAPVVSVAGAGCPDDGCRHGVALPAGDPGGHPGVWSVCLAVLGTLTVTLLLAALVLRWRRPVPGARRPGGRSAGSRAPPGRPVGLRLATVSVLRR